MFVGRKKELASLEKCYQKEFFQTVLIYGREGIGKTSLVKEFVKQKPFVYYRGRELSSHEQWIQLMPYLNRLVALCQKEEKKVCFVLDEFDLLQKSNKSFVAEMLAWLEEKEVKSSILLLFVSSQIPWIENQMVEEFGEKAAVISHTIKLKEFSFLEMVNRFPESSTQECITIYSILGGIPGYLDYWNVKKTIEENVISLILQPTGPLYREANRFLKTNLRELPFYNTILTVLAEDEPKLNYIYQRTEFSRAKISVYIKNLIQMGVAEKYDSFESTKKDMTKRGLYGISDALIHFWYKFVFPQMSVLEMEGAEAFYERYVRDSLDAYVEMTFEKVCHEYLHLMNQYGKLPETFDMSQVFYGKEGRIPIVAKGEDDKLLVGTCLWSPQPMNREDFADLVKKTEQLGKIVDWYYLFSKEGFTLDLSVMAKGMNNIELIDLDSL